MSIKSRAMNIKKGGEGKEEEEECHRGVSQATSITQKPECAVLKCLMNELWSCWTIHVTNELVSCVSSTFLSREICRCHVPISALTQLSTLERIPVKSQTRAVQFKPH